MSKVKNKVIELSLSRNYVCNWGLWEAVREILQNGQDSEKDNHPLHIDYREADECLVISNDDVTLDMSSLVLGNGTKQDNIEAIGKYGEGYKLALLVLLRLDKHVEIHTGNEVWVPKFVNSKTFDTEVLAIERRIIEGTPDKERITFVIDNITISEFRKLRLYGIRIAKETGWYTGKTVESEYGQILLSDEYRGRFYVEGLYIQTDKNFKYGYSFKNEVVDLDRDRKAINYYDLCELTTKSILTQTEDFSIVETSLSSKTHDSKDLQYFYNQASSDFKEGFAEHYIEKHNLTKDTFVGTEKEVALSDAEEKVVVDEVTARWVNDGLGKGEEYSEIRSMARDKDNKEAAYKIYNKSAKKELYDWLLDNQKRLSKKQMTRLVAIIEKIEVSGTSVIREEVLTNILETLNINSGELNNEE